VAVAVVDEDFHSYSCIGLVRFIHISYLYTAI
jgi:hypothetical protein